MLLTRDAIEKLRSPGGHFSKASMDALGIQWPPTLSAMLYLEVSDEAYDKAVSLRDFVKGNKDKWRRERHLGPATLFAEPQKPGKS